MKVGVLILGLFGALWCVWGIWLWANGPGLWLLLPAAVFAILLTSTAIAPGVKTDGRARKRLMRVFGLASAGEGLAIGLSFYILYQAGRLDLLPHAIASIVALHFIPVATFGPAPRYFVVAALMLLTVVTAAGFLGQPFQSIAICLGSALILWTAGASLLIAPIGREIPGPEASSPPQ